MHKKASSLTAILAAATLSAPIQAQETNNHEWMDDARCILHTTLVTNDGYQTEEDFFTTLAFVDSIEYRVPLDSLTLDASTLTARFPDEVQGYRTVPLDAARISLITPDSPESARVSLNAPDSFAKPDSLASLRFDGPHEPFPEYIILNMSKIPWIKRRGAGAFGRGDDIKEHDRTWGLLTTQESGWFPGPCDIIDKHHREPSPYFEVEYFTQETIQNGTPR